MYLGTIIYPYFCKMSSWNFSAKWAIVIVDECLRHAVLVPGFYLFNFNVFIRKWHSNK